MDSNLSQLPREVLHQIVLYLAPTAVLAFEQVCRRFHELCGPLVWRQKCITYFRYWNYERKISHRLTAPIDKTSWKQVYLERHEIDRKVSCGIDSILASQVSRIKKVKSIVEKGYEAKDVLLRCLLVADGGEDVLARRWYSGAILSCLHRCIAIEQWLSFRNAQKEKASLEHALGAFDMFVIEDGDGDLEDISIMLDRIAHHFRSTNPEFDELTTRKKAISLAEYVRAQNLVGIKGDIDAHYHDLQNNFIGKALQDGQHPSLPLISVAIYCSIAQRLGVNAKPCGFPLHVLAIIWSSHGQTLDDDKSGMAIPPQPIYMDPFRSECEIPVETLKSQLVEMGVPRQEHIRLLDAASTEEIVARCARNIIASFRVFRGNAAVSGHAYPKSAFYAAVWALLLLPKSNEARVARLQQAQYLPVVLNQIENEFPLDVLVMEKYYNSSSEANESGITDTLQAIRASDNAPRTIKARNAESLVNVRYRVGQVFQHKRFQYYAVITGWDIECKASNQWMSQMRVHDLNKGKYQGFYHVLVEDRSTRYVAEENIQLIHQGPINSLMTIAGQHFKRWDDETKSFVSNIRDEYPDD